MFFAKGVLLDEGFGPMFDFKLTSSENITVKIMNRNKAYVQVHLTVNVNTLLIIPRLMYIFTFKL